MGAIKIVVVRLPGRNAGSECIIRRKRAFEVQGRVVIARVGATGKDALRAAVLQFRTERRHAESQRRLTA